MKHLVLFLFITGCIDLATPPIIDEDMQEFVTSVEIYFDIKVTCNVTLIDEMPFVENVKEDMYVIGLCVKPSNIYILRSLFERGNNIVIEEVLLHEIGHCMYDFKHDNSKDNEGRPISLMVLGMDYIPDEKYHEILKERFKQKIHKNKP